MSTLKVAVDKILPITEARARFNGLVEEVAGEAEGMYVLTKGGTPVVAVVNVGYLERLMEVAGVDGGSVEPTVQGPAVRQASPLPSQVIEHVDQDPGKAKGQADQGNDGGLTVVGGLAD